MGSGKTPLIVGPNGTPPAKICQKNPQSFILCVNTIPRESRDMGFQLLSFCFGGELRRRLEIRKFHEPWDFHPPQYCPIAIHRRSIPHGRSSRDIVPLRRISYLCCKRGASHPNPQSNAHRYRSWTNTSREFHPVEPHWGKSRE